MPGRERRCFRVARHGLDLPNRRQVVHPAISPVVRSDKHLVVANTSTRDDVDALDGSVNLLEVFRINRVQATPSPQESSRVGLIVDGDSPHHNSVRGGGNEVWIRPRRANARGTRALKLGQEALDKHIVAKKGGLAGTEVGKSQRDKKITRQMRREPSALQLQVNLKKLLVGVKPSCCSPSDYRANQRKVVDS